LRSPPRLSWPRPRQAGPRQAGPRQAGPRQAGPPLDVIAIDHLPALLPLESSADFSAQLLPALIQLADLEQSPWGPTRDLFLQHCAQEEED
jgi:hypothetical protein